MFPEKARDRKQKTLIADKEAAGRSERGHGRGLPMRGGVVGFTWLVRRLKGRSRPPLVEFGFTNLGPVAFGGASVLARTPGAAGSSSCWTMRSR